MSINPASTLSSCILRLAELSAVPPRPPPPLSWSSVQCRPGRYGKVNRAGQYRSAQGAGRCGGRGCVARWVSRLAKNSALKLKKNQTKFNFLFFNSHLRIITQSPDNVTSTLNFHKIFRSYKCPARFIFTLPVLSYSDGPRPSGNPVSLCERHSSRTHTRQTHQLGGGGGRLNCMYIELRREL